jgi:hypothetical protein
MRIDRYRDEQRRLRDEEQRRQAEDHQHQEDEQHRQAERDRVFALAESAITLTRDVLAREIRDGVSFPEEAPTKLRIALSNEMADEGLAEVKRLESKR